MGRRHSCSKPATQRGKKINHGGDGTSKSAASRRFVALSAERRTEWMSSDLFKQNLLLIQIDGLQGAIAR